MEPKVFGLGLSKTGISSLWRALNGLGYRVTHYPSRPFCVGGLPEEWDGAVDIPVCRYFPHLDELHPGSKFILTTRLFEPWVDSLEAHWRRRPRETLSHWGMQNREAIYKGAAWLPEHLNQQPLEDLKFDNEMWKRHAARIYYNYHKKVFAYFKERPDDLLIIGPGWDDNWSRLLAFMAPAWPHENSRATPLHNDHGRRALIQEHAFERIEDDPDPTAA